MMLHGRWSQSSGFRPRAARTLLAAAILCALFLATSGHVDAGTLTPPNIVVSVEVNGQPSWVGHPIGQPTATESEFLYNGAYTYPENYKLTWDMRANPDPFVIANTVVTNLTAVTNIYSVLVTMPIGGALAPSSATGGSVQGGITADGGGGTLSTAGPGTAYYTARIDGVDFHQLYPDPQPPIIVGSFGSGNLASTSFGLPGLTFPGPQINATIGIRLDFTLTPGDQASFTSVFAAEAFGIPEPSTLALLGFGVVGLMAAGIRGHMRRR